MGTPTSRDQRGTAIPAAAHVHGPTPSAERRVNGRLNGPGLHDHSPKAMKTGGSNHPGGSTTNRPSGSCQHSAGQDAHQPVADILAMRTPGQVSKLPPRPVRAWARRCQPRADENHDDFADSRSLFPFGPRVVWRQMRVAEASPPPTRASRSLQTASRPLVTSNRLTTRLRTRQRTQVTKH